MPPLDPPTPPGGGRPTGKEITEICRGKKIKQKNFLKKLEYFFTFLTSVCDGALAKCGGGATPRPYYVKNLTRQRLLDAQEISNLPTWGELKTLAPLEFSVNHM